MLLLDARNDYEVRMGTFRGSRNPETESFHELPLYMTQNLDPARHKRIAMFCTGGIRCEKASAFLLGRGFEAVYQLRGGILHYLEKVKREDSLWEGECFVFDERVSLDHGLQKGSITICDDCKAWSKWRTRSMSSMPFNKLPLSQSGAPFNRDSRKRGSR